MSNEALIFKIASVESEFKQIHALNYETFVKEIPQHKRNEKGMLIDKFHDENTYVICLREEELVGMLALRDQRPLSLDDKLEDLESYLPTFTTILEYRLLAIKQQYRNTAIFTGIMKKAFKLAIDRTYDIAVISGSVRQIKLYEHLGFRSFGPLVGEKHAQYQPMFIDVTAAINLQKTSPTLL